MPLAHSILTLDFPPLQDGGIARWMDQLALGLLAEGRAVRVLTRGRKRAAFEHDRQYPAEVVRMPGHGWVRQHPRLLRLYRFWLGRSLEGRVLHAATFGVAEPLLKAVIRHHVRLVVYLHGLELAEAKTHPEDRARLEAVIAADPLLIANSHRVAELARGLGARRVEVVAPAIDAARITSAGPDLRERFGATDGPVILTLGRLVERKGQDTVLKALPLVLAAFPAARYVIAGQGPDRPRLEAMASELGVSHAVCFAGFISEAELASAYRSADVYVMLSRETESDLEGYGITYLEAGLAERPVVAGRSGGVEDAVIDGVTGDLVPPGDPAAAAAALIGLLRDPERRAALGRAARLRVETELNHRSMARTLIRLTEVGA